MNLHLVNSITTTLVLDEDMTAVVTGVLNRFPKGTRVRLAITEVSPPTPVPKLDEYRQIVANARRKTPPGPWKTTEEALRALREGEGN